MIHFYVSVPNITPTTEEMEGSLVQSFMSVKTIGLILSLLSVLSGFISSYYWYLASKVTVTPAWELEIDGDREKNIMGWVTGNMIAFTKSGSLNKRASIWTAVTTALTAISSVLATVSA